MWIKIVKIFFLHSYSTARYILDFFEIKKYRDVRYYTVQSTAQMLISLQIEKDKEK